MKPADFKKWLLPGAKNIELKYGIPHLFIIAQAALESGWGEHAPGNMLFGVKDHDGMNGNEQLLTTTEYLTIPNAKFPQIISVVQVAGKKLWKYIVKDWFRKYNTPEDSLTDHAYVLLGPRYKPAFQFKTDPYKFTEEIARVGYATDPDYAGKIKAIIKMIEKL
jgi:flagellum-specific peptidoglycan hydrolase FlgJ